MMLEAQPYDPTAVAVASRAMPSKTTEQRIETNINYICSPTRIKILRALSEAQLSAGDVALVIGRSRSATSQHLRLLRDAGIVTTARNGNVVRYRLAENQDADVLSAIAQTISSA
jgi:DNA-binding transcriptional ArsR family regulator